MHDNTELKIYIWLFALTIYVRTQVLFTLLGGAVAMMFLTPATLAVAMVIAALAV